MCACAMPPLPCRQIKPLPCPAQVPQRGVAFIGATSFTAHLPRSFYTGGPHHAMNRPGRVAVATKLGPSISTRGRGANMVVSTLLPESGSIGLKVLAVAQRGTRSGSYARLPFRVVLPCIHAGRRLWSCYCDPVAAGRAETETQPEHVPTPTWPWRGVSGHWRPSCCDSSLLQPTIEGQDGPCVAMRKIFPLPGWGGRGKGPHPGRSTWRQVLCWRGVALAAATDWRASRGQGP